MAAGNPTVPEALMLAAGFYAHYPERWTQGALARDALGGGLPYSIYDQDRWRTIAVCGQYWCLSGLLGALVIVGSDRFGVYSNIIKFLIDEWTAPPIDVNDRHDMTPDQLSRLLCRAAAAAIRKRVV